MAVTSEISSPEKNGKPTRGAAPVIRRIEVAEEDLGSRMLNRVVPAWVISGAIHIVVIGFFVLFLSSSKDATAKPDDGIVTTQVEDQKEEKENLENDELGFNADLKPASDADREEEVTVDAKKQDTPVGLENQPDAVAPVTQAQGPDAGATAGINSTPTDAGLMPVGTGGGGSAFTTPGMEGRNSGATKDKLLADNGGNSVSEAAVTRGLVWLAKQQLKDGSWEYDGASKDKIAATGMALLPFLAAGHTHKSNGPFKKTVESGMKWLIGRLGSGGGFIGSSGMYSQAIASIVLCEAAGMTDDKPTKDKAAQSTAYIVKAQGKNGSWGYSSGADGDTSIVGWQIQALQSAKLAGIKFDRDKVFKDAEKFLINVGNDGGAKYGYSSKGDSSTLTPVGLLCRYYIGWTPRKPEFGRGVEFLKTMLPAKDRTFDMYYYYYATQVMHFYEGPDWHKVWNPKMRDLLIDLQDKSADLTKKGSWEKDGGIIGGQCGRLGTTCLALLTLEVYYRHLPLYKRDAVNVLQ